MTMTSDSNTIEVFVSPSGEMRHANLTTSAYLGEQLGRQSRAIGMREMELAPREAAAITRLLDDPTVPVQSGAPVPAGNPAVLQPRVH